MNRRITQPIKWHGGKHYLASKIIELMPPHTRYLEAFAGGLSVLLRKPCEGIAEWVNDTNDDLMQFWFVLQTPMLFERFRRVVEAVPLSESCFDAAVRKMNRVAELFAPERPPFTVDAVSRAAAFFIKMRMSRQGLGRDYCTPTRRLRRGMNEQVSAWLSAVEELPDVHRRLRRVEVWSRPAVKAIEALDGPDLLVYADPPYLHETRSSVGEYGANEMTEEQHEELAGTLSRMEGTFLLSGYRSEAYDDWAFNNGWKRVDFELPNNASSKAVKERKVESVWMNFDPSTGERL